MVVDFSKIEAVATPNFKGGNGVIDIQMFVDDAGKIGKLCLHPGTSVGLHTHEGSYEVIYFVAGLGKIIEDGVTYEFTPGMVHYCPEGHAHTLINDENAKEDLVVFAVIPNT